MVTSTEESSNQATDDLIELVMQAKSQNTAIDMGLASSSLSDDTDQILRLLMEAKLSQTKSADGRRRQENPCSGYTTPADVELLDEPEEELLQRNKPARSDSEESGSGCRLKPPGNMRSIGKPHCCPIKRVIPAISSSESESDDGGVEAGDKAEGFDEQAYQNERKEGGEEGRSERGEEGDDDDEARAYNSLSEWGGLCISFSYMADHQIQI